MKINKKQINERGNLEMQENLNKRIHTSQKGITLIALVITIVIMLILVTVTVTVSINGGLFDSAKEATFKQEMASILEEFNVFVINKTMENDRFEQGSLNASKELLTYNTKEGLEGDIYTVLANAPKKHVDNFEVIKGELIYSSQNAKELRWAEDMGIKVNPYLIVDGVLLSSETNLYLLDEETGTLVIPSTVTAIGEGSFGNVTGVKKIIIPSTVKEIKKNAFAGCTSIEEVIFETRVENGVEVGVETIGNKAFSGCTNLVSIELPNTVKNASAGVFYGCSTLKHIVLSNSMKSLPNQLFWGCKSLDSIIIPEGVISIGFETFLNCSNLQEISLPKSLSTVAEGAFYGCRSLKNIEIAEGNDNLEFSEEILFNGDKTQIIYILPSAIASSQTTFRVPSGVTTLSQGLIDNFTQITKVVIPASVTNIADVRFFNWNITEIEVDENNPNYTTSGGALCNKNKTILYYYYQNARNVTNIVLEEQIEQITAWAFYNCINLQSIEIGKEVSNINYHAFYHANKLTTVNINEENSNYMSEGRGIYSKDQTKLILVAGQVTEFEIPEGIEKIGSYAFYNQQSLTRVTIPNTVNTIENYAFNSCTSLEKIEIPNSIQTIGTGTFNNCNKLTQIKIDKEPGSISGSPWGAIIRRQSNNLAKIKEIII